MEARAAETSVGRAGKATAPPEKVTTPSIDDVVTTLDDVVDATVMMGVAVRALAGDAMFRLVTVTPLGH